MLNPDSNLCHRFTHPPGDCESRNMIWHLLWFNLTCHQLIDRKFRAPHPITCSYHPSASSQRTFLMSLSVFFDKVIWLPTRLIPHIRVGTKLHQQAHCFYIPDYPRHMTNRFCHPQAVDSPGLPPPAIVLLWKGEIPSTHRKVNLCCPGDGPLPAPTGSFHFAEQTLGDTPACTDLWRRSLNWGSGNFCTPKYKAGVFHSDSNATLALYLIRRS